MRMALQQRTPIPTLPTVTSPPSSPAPSQTIPQAAVAAALDSELTSSGVLLLVLLDNHLFLVVSLLCQLWAACMQYRAALAAACGHCKLVHDTKVCDHVESW